MSEVARIREQMRRAFEGGAWHGPAVRELIEGIDEKKAAARPIAGAHTIWELTLHIAAWKGIVRRRTLGERVVDVSPAEDWPPARGAWPDAVAALERAHEELMRVVAGLPEARLAEGVSGKDYAVYDLLHGIVQHDLYHAGQIALLRK
jgi:uncharacterized damage-inducible protein DinB